MGLSLHFFAEKVTQTTRHGGLLEKVPQFGQIDDFSCFFAKWGSFCTFLLKSWPKRRNMVVCSKKLQVLAKSTIFHAFPRNEALFASFCLKVHPNAETWCFARESFTEKLTQTARRGSLLEKVASFGQIDDFSCLFAKLGTFCNFLLKSWPKRRNMVVCSIKLHIFAESTIFHGFPRNEALSATFCRKVHPNAETWLFAREGFTFWRNRRFFTLSREMRRFLQLFTEKLTQTREHGCLLEKVASFGQIDDFSCFFAKLGTFCNFLLKSWPKRRNMVVCSKKLHILTNSTIFHAFSRNEAPFATFCWKVDPNAGTWWFAAESFTIWPNRRFFMLLREMRHFLQLFTEKLTETPKHGGLLEKVASFGQIDDFPCFLAKSGTFATFSLKGDPSDETWWFARKSSTVWPNRRVFMLSCEMGLFLHFFAEKCTQTPKHGGLLKKIASFGQIDNFHAFPRNEALFASFCLKVHPNAETWWFAREGFTVWPNRRFLMLFREMKHFLHLFTEKLTQTAKRGSLLEKVSHFGQIDDFPCFFAKWALFATSCLKVDPNANTWWFPRKSCKFWPNRRFFMLFCEIRHFLQLFAEKVTKTSNYCSLLKKVEHFCQIDDFSCFRAKSGTFWNFFLKRWPKRRDMVVCSKKFHSLAKSTIFHAFSQN